MLEVKQKTGNYCFGACIAPALLDEGYDRLIELIIERFPTELQSKKRGVPDGLKRWKKNIDNNPVENSIRPVAIGKKNYLFAGSHEAA